MSDKKHSVFVDNLTVLATPEGFQKYIFGTKKNGQPRALYDVVKDFTPKRKKKKHKNKDKGTTSYKFYTTVKKKNGKKNKNKNKYWHI